MTERTVYVCDACGKEEWMSIFPVNWVKVIVQKRTTKDAELHLCKDCKRGVTNRITGDLPNG